MKHEGCTKLDDSKYWCYTEVMEVTEGMEVPYGVTGKYGYCDEHCPSKWLNAIGI